MIDDVLLHYRSDCYLNLVIQCL